MRRRKDDRAPGPAGTGCDPVWPDPPQKIPDRTAMPTPHDREVVEDATTKTHIARIFAKLNLRDGAQAVVLSNESGLVQPGDASLTSHRQVLASPSGDT